MPFFYSSLSNIITISCLPVPNAEGKSAVALLTTLHPCSAYELIAFSKVCGLNLPENHLSFCVKTLYLFILYSLLVYNIIKNFYNTYYSII